MKTRPAIARIVLTGLICLGSGLFIAFLARDLYPDYAGPIVLVGILIMGLSLSLFFVRVMLKGRMEEFAANLRVTERVLYLASLVALAGSSLGAWGQGTLGVVGIIASACGTIAAAWFFLKAIPEVGRP